MGFFIYGYIFDNISKIAMKSIQYTGTNYQEVKEFAQEKILAPYFCMGFNMLSLITKDGFVTVNEGDYIIKGDDGEFYVK